MQRWGNALGLLAVLALVASACSSGPKATAATVTATAEGSGKEVSYGFDVPESITGGLVDLTLDNQGDAEHEAQLLTIGDGKTLEDLGKALEATGEGAPIPAWIGIEGGVATIADGETKTASLVLGAGSYAFVCFIDDHIQRGMMVPVTVTEGEVAELPATDATVSAIDYDFEIDGLVAGENTVTFSNDGDEPHFATALAFAEGVTLEQAEADVQLLLQNEKPKHGEPEEAGGFVALDPDRALVTTFTAEAGRVYGFACFLSDRAGGPPHVAKGMIKVIEIT